MNEENEWDHRIKATVKEGSADYIRMDKVDAALKKMERQSPRHVRASSRDDEIHRGYWNSVDTGFMYCNCERRLYSRDWKSSMVLPIDKGKGIQWSVDLTEELNCWNML